MIDPKSRSKEWILESCGKNKVNDPTLMEKTIRAFSLLEALAKSGCPFLFKGGSALMLQLACTQRLSVDIDIVCPPGTDVISYLEPYAEEYGFGEIVPTERADTIRGKDVILVIFHGMYVLSEFSISQLSYGRRASDRVFGHHRLSLPSSP